MFDGVDEISWCVLDEETKCLLTVRDPALTSIKCENFQACAHYLGSSAWKLIQHLFILSSALCEQARSFVTWRELLQYFCSSNAQHMEANQLRRWTRSTYWGPSRSQRSPPGVFSVSTFIFIRNAHSRIQSCVQDSWDRSTIGTIRAAVATPFLETLK